MCWLFGYLVSDKSDFYRSHSSRPMASQYAVFIYVYTSQLISNWIFFFVASFVKKSLRIEIVDMLSEAKLPSPKKNYETFINIYLRYRIV